MRHFAFAILFFISMLSVWAEVSVQTQVSENQVTLNQPFVFAIDIVAEDTSDAPKVVPPDFPENLPFQVLRKDPPRPSHNSQTTIINGKITSSSTYTIRLLYQLKPKFEGHHQIPALELEVNGEKHQTQPVTITVGKQAAAAAGPQPQLVVAFSSEQAMLGYPVTLSYDLVFPERLNARAPQLNLPDEFLAEHFTQQGEPTQETRQRTYNGLLCTVIHLELQLIPKHEGNITLPAAVLSCQVPDQQRRRRRGGIPGSFFDDDFADPFGMFGSWRELTVACDELPLEVQPLPTEGRPADFTGIVGQLRAKASISTTEATVGEPILLDLTLSGAPALVNAKLPDLANLPEIAQHFKVSGDDPPLEAEGGVVFQRTLRATTPGDLEIPAIPFSYFDPAAREYRTAATEPIRLKVAAARQITLEDAQGTTPVTPAVDNRTATTIAAQTAGLEPDFPPEELAQNRLAPFLTPRRFLAPALLLAIPPALWLLCALGTLVARRRNATGAERAASGAKGELLKTVARLRNDDPHAAAKFSDALQAFFTARFHLPPGAITYADAEAAALQNGFTTEQITPFQDIFATCEAAQFAGGAFNLEATRNQLKIALKPF